MAVGKVTTRGSLGVRRIRLPRASLWWKIKNLRSVAPIWKHWLAKLLNMNHMLGTLHMVLRRVDGTVINYGLVSTKLVTTAFVNDMVDNLIAEAAPWGDYKYHQSGTGTTNPAITDTDIESKCGTIAKDTGTQVEGAANEYVSVATITYDASYAVTEHALTNDASDATGDLMDRHEFTPVNVENTDQIEFTFTLTCTAGG